MSSKRLNRERKTLIVMVRLYCHQNHHSDQERCRNCDSLLNYALDRLSKCPFGENKPACNLCEIHCYHEEKRKAIRQVMRYAGPRMMWTHPWLTMCHLADKFGKAGASV